MVKHELLDEQMCRIFVILYEKGVWRGRRYLGVGPNSTLPGRPFRQCRAKKLKGGKMKEFPEIDRKSALKVSFKRV